MFGIPYVKAKYLNDKYSQKIIEKIKHPDIYQKNCDILYNNIYTDAILTRDKFFKFVLEKEKMNYEQLLVLSSGLDTKTDTLECLNNKLCFGIDILSEEINYIKYKTNVLTKIKILYCDFNNIKQVDIIDNLIEEGFSIKKKTFILWEGGTYYLHDHIVKNTLYYFINNVNTIGYAIDFAGNNTINQKSNIMGKNLLEYFQSINQEWYSFYSFSQIKHLNKCSSYISNVYKFSDFNNKNSVIEDNIFYYLYVHL